MNRTHGAKRVVRGLWLLAATLMFGVVAAKADAVLEWNEIAINTAVANGQNPFAQARLAAIVQVAVFEAVNSIKGEYQPYLGSIVAPRGASVDAAAIQAAYHVLHATFPNDATLDAERASSLAEIPDGTAKNDGIAVGDAAGAAMITLRANDGSSPPQFKVPGPAGPGVYQATPSCPNVGGVAVGTLYQWQFVTPFAIKSASDYLLRPPPELSSNLYAWAYNEVKTVGSASANSTERPQDRADVVLLYAATSPTMAFNQVARQVAEQQHRRLPDNARALALLNMAISDSFVASFYNKYHYNWWRPETAIHAGATDGNRKTEGDPGWKPFIPAPCFPGYPSNHGTGSNAGAEVLRRIYGEAGHWMTVSNPALPDIVLEYTSFTQITDDISDARVYGGIHFRTDQFAGAELGRAVATDVYKNNLRPARGLGWWDFE